MILIYDIMVSLSTGIEILIEYMVTIYRTSSFTRSSYFVPNLCDSQGINVNMIFNEFSKKSLVYEGRG